MKLFGPASGRGAASLALLLLPALAAQGGSTAAAPPFFDNPKAALSLAEEALGGESGRFYPSAARTATGEPVPARLLMDAQACGRCHADVARQWSSSTHRAGFDSPWFAKSFATMQAATGVTESRLCGGCHTPALLLSGGMDQPAAAAAALPAAHAGVSCSACHLVSEVRSTMGNADYEIAVPPLHGLAVAEEPFLAEIHDYLVMVDSEAHRRAYSRPSMTGQLSAELCSTCHKGHTDEPLNGTGWFREHNDYEQWQANSVSGYGARSFYFPQVQTCVDCHMPRVASRDPGAEGGQVRSHRFATGNTGMPLLSGDREQLQAVVDYLKDGHVTVDVFALAQGTGEEERIAAPIDRARPAVRRGDSVRIDVVVRTRNVGHLFPGGKVTTPDIWLELKGVDSRGRVVFWSGRADESSPVDPGAHLYRARLTDGTGAILDKGDTWNTQAFIYNRRVLPNAAEAVHFRLEVPPDAGDTITLTARLNHRTYSPEFTRWAFEGRKDAPTLPITVMAEDTATLRVVDAGAAPPELATVDDAADAERWNDYGIGMLLQGNARGAIGAFRHATKLAPDDAGAFLNISRAALGEGDVETARPALERAAELAPDSPPTLVFQGQLWAVLGDHEKALSYMRKADALRPRDRVLLSDLSSILMLEQDYKAAAEVFERILDIDSTDRGAHNGLMIAYRALGDRERSLYHQQANERFRPLESNRVLTGAFWQAHPHENNERQGVHEHRSIPLSEIPAAREPAR